MNSKEYCLRWLSSWDIIDKPRLGFGFAEFQQVVESQNWHFALANKVITVAGTNGKGSCIQGLHDLAIYSGLTVLSFTSPHISQLNERFKYNNNFIGCDLLAKKLALIKDLEPQFDCFSFFEFLTLVCFSLAVELKPDLLLLEVGLGGRLDAVNATQHDCAIITSIALDHQQFLGDSLESIAKEKAGIIRKKTPLIWGGSLNIPAVIADVAKNMQAPIVMAKQDDYPSALLPINSLHAASLAWQQLFADVLAKPEIKQVLLASKLQARFEIVNKFNNTIIMDVAHNPAAIKHLVNKINQQGYANLAVVFNFCHDKDHVACLQYLKPIISNWYCLDLMNPRLLDAIELKDSIKHIGCIESNIQIIKQQSISELFINSEDRVFLVCGSFLVVDAVCSELAIAPIG